MLDGTQSAYLAVFQSAGIVSLLGAFSQAIQHDGLKFVCGFNCVLRTVWLVMKSIQSTRKTLHRLQLISSQLAEYNPGIELAD